MPDFLAQSVLDALQIRSSEDAFVDQLLADAPAHGAALLVAEVPRAYLDLNRAPDELDPAVIEGIDRAPHNPRVSSGLGVIPRVVAGGRAIYRGKLARNDAEFRILRYWHPYHSRLKTLLDESLAQFGQAILIDCHSMPHEAIEAHSRPGHPRPDVVLGDRFGAACAEDISGFVEDELRRHGLRVTRNKPYAGGFITQNHGAPHRGQHALQIEINRSLYMNEATLEKTAGFQHMCTLLDQLCAVLLPYLENRFTPSQLAAE